MAVLARDSTPHPDGDRHVSRPAATDALAPVVQLDLVNPVDRPTTDPTNVFDLRVRHVSDAVASS